MLDLHAYPPEPKKQQTKNRHAVRTHDSTRTPLDLHKPSPLLRNQAGRAPTPRPGYPGTARPRALRRPAHSAPSPLPVSAGPRRFCSAQQTRHVPSHDRAEDRDSHQDPQDQEYRDARGGATRCPLPHPHHPRRRCVRTLGARLWSSRCMCTTYTLALCTVPVFRTPDQAAHPLCASLRERPPEHLSLTGRVPCVRAPALSTR